MYTFTCQVETKNDLILFHKVAQLYLEMGSDFVKKAVTQHTESTDSKVEHPKPETSKEEKEASGQDLLPTGLMGELVKHCTCTDPDTNCYAKLTRHDRIPWRLVQDQGITKYVNAKHGTYLVPNNCKLSERATVKFGYVFENRKDAKTIRADRLLDRVQNKETVSKERDTLAQANAKREIEVLTTKMKQIQTELPSLTEFSAGRIARQYNLKCAKCFSLQRTNKSVNYFEYGKAHNAKEMQRKELESRSWTCTNQTEDGPCGAVDWIEAYQRRIRPNQFQTVHNKAGLTIEQHVRVYDNSELLDSLAQTLSDKERKLSDLMKSINTNKVTIEKPTSERKDWRRRGNTSHYNRSNQSLAFKERAIEKIFSDLK